jgi:hypothetical protein
MAHGLWAFQQESIPDSLTNSPYVSVNLSAVVSGKEAAPYWLFSNNSNRLEEDTYLGTWASLNLLRDPGSRRLDYFYGLEANGFLGNKGRLVLTQAYAGLRTKHIQLSAGLREEFFGLNDSTLSIGNLFYTNNARPIPKIVLSTNGWLNAPILKKFLSFKAYFAHGWFEGDRFQSNAFLHHKYAYLRISLLEKRLQLVAGLNHAGQWAGTNRRNGVEQPATLTDFARVLIAKNGGGTADENDQLNALGNHLGSSDIGVSLKLDKITIRNYWQFLWEDKSGLAPFNWRDGVVGFSIKSNSKKGLISGFNLEIIRTGNQDAVKFDEEGNAFLEPDNFFNNTIYADGWTYQGRVIANPVFLSLNQGTNALNKVLNRVNGVNVAIEGNYRQFDYRLQVRHFKNAGTHFENFTPRFRLTSIEGNLQVPIKKAHLRLRGILEIGNYPRNNAGLVVTYIRRFNL